MFSTFFKWWVLTLGERNSYSTFHTRILMLKYLYSIQSTWYSFVTSTFKDYLCKINSFVILPFKYVYDISCQWFLFLCNITELMRLYSSMFAENITKYSTCRMYEDEGSIYDVANVRNNSLHVCSITITLRPLNLILLHLKIWQTVTKRKQCLHLWLL